MTLLTISAPDDEWLIEALADDLSVAADLFDMRSPTTISFEASRIAEVIKCLEEHEENCLMQDSAISAALLDGILIGLRVFA